MFLANMGSVTKRMDVFILIRLVLLLLLTKNSKDKCNAYTTANSNWNKKHTISKPNHNNDQEHYSSRIKTTTTKIQQYNDNDWEGENINTLQNKDDTFLLLDNVNNINSEDRNSINDVSNVNIDPYEIHWKYYPKTYISYHVSLFTNSTIPLVDNITGDILTNNDNNNNNYNIWDNVPWSDTFHDIQGSEYDGIDNITHPVPGITKFKSLYDDNYLYISGIVYPAYNISTEVHYIERNSPIFHLDSDFEIFIDVNCTTHQYKEIEINAINTIWNLLLNKPYSDGGVEHSGRICNNNISNPYYYDTKQQKTATKLWNGTLNDNSISNDNNNKTGALWTVETALAYTDLYYTTPTTTTTTTTAETIASSSISSTSLPTTQEKSRTKTTSTSSSSSSSSSGVSSITNNNNIMPKSGTFWKINFSRVEKQGTINWTWQSQIRWDPSIQQYTGFIDMHIPDAWGYLYFTDTINNNNDNTINSALSSSLLLPPRDPTFPARFCASTIYYALQYYKEQNGSYTNIVSDLIVPYDIIHPFDITIGLPNHDLFLVTVKSTPIVSPVTIGTATTTTTTISTLPQKTSTWASIRSDRYMLAGVNDNEKVQTS